MGLGNWDNILAKWPDAKFVTVDFHGRVAVHLAEQPVPSPLANKWSSTKRVELDLMPEPPRDEYTTQIEARPGTKLQPVMAAPSQLPGQGKDPNLPQSDQVTSVADMIAGVGPKPVMNPPVGAGAGVGPAPELPPEPAPGEPANVVATLAPPTVEAISQPSEVSMVAVMVEDPVAVATHALAETVEGLVRWVSDHSSKADPALTTLLEQAEQIREALAALRTRPVNG